jgi:hypothetical protein
LLIYKGHAPHSTAKRSTVHMDMQFVEVNSSQPVFGKKIISRTQRQT